MILKYGIGLRAHATDEEFLGEVGRGCVFPPMFPNDGGMSGEDPLQPLRERVEFGGGVWFPPPVPMELCHE